MPPKPNNSKRASYLDPVEATKAPAVDDPERTKRGWLRKRSPSTLSPFQDRWCVLKDDIFTYYLKPEHEDAPIFAKGSFHLRAVKSIQIGTLNVGVVSHHNVMVIEAPDLNRKSSMLHGSSDSNNVGTRRFEFKAGKDGQKDHGEHEMSEWIAVLRHCLKRYQQGESSSTEPVASEFSADRSMGRIDSVVEDSQPDSSDRATAQLLAAGTSDLVESGALVDGGAAPETADTGTPWYHAIALGVKELVDPSSPSALAQVWCSWCKNRCDFTRVSASLGSFERDHYRCGTCGRLGVKCIVCYDSLAQLWGPEHGNRADSFCVWCAWGSELKRGQPYRY